MTALKLRAALTAFFLGTASLAAVCLVAAPAQAATLSFKVGTALKEAQALASAGNYKGAMAKVNEAEAAPGKTADDQAYIAKMKDFLSIKSVDTSTPKGALAKFSQDYNSGKWKEVIADADMLRKVGQLSGENQLIIAQAYMKAQDYPGCIRYTKALSGSDTALEVQARCAYEMGDHDTQRSALETLVAHSGKAETWALLLKLNESGGGLNDHNTLDINRIKFMTGNITTKDDYILLAQLEMEYHNFAEAQSIMEKGASVLTDDRSKKLLDLAKTQGAAAAASLQKDIAAASAQPQGDALVQLGENMIGMGKAKDAIGVIQNGMKKPLKDQAYAQTRLGQAYLAAGQKPDAQKAFAAVKAPPKDASIAHLWGLVARR